MGALTDFEENRVLDHLLGTTEYVFPDKPWLALYTEDPGEVGGGGEVDGDGYARVQLSFTAASGGSASNEAEVQFPKANSDWGEITHIAFFDAEVDGEMTWYKALASPLTVVTNDVVVVPVGGITVGAD